MVVAPIVPEACGVEDRERGRKSVVVDPTVVDGVISIEMSSSGPNEPIGRKGGGVW